MIAECFTDFIRVVEKDIGCVDRRPVLGFVECICTELVEKCTRGDGARQCKGELGRVGVEEIGVPLEPELGVWFDAPAVENFGFERPYDGR